MVIDWTNRNEMSSSNLTVSFGAYTNAVELHLSALKSTGKMLSTINDEEKARLRVRAL